MRVIAYVTLLCSLALTCLPVSAAKPVAKKPAVSKPAVAKPKVITPPVVQRELPKIKDRQPIPKVVAVPGQLVLSPAAASGPRLSNSWPLIISVNLWRRAATPDANGKLPTIEPITIKAKQGSWREALVLEVKDSTGKKAEWPAHPVKNPEASVTLGVDDTAAAEWWLEPTETQSLAAGEYKLSVSFDPKLVDGLPTDAALDTYYVTVEEEPSPLDAETANEKQLQLAMLAALKDDAAAATSLIDRLLKDNPGNIGGHRLKSSLLIRQGKPREAVSAIDKALMEYSKQFPDACPPAGMLIQRAKLLQEMGEPETAKPDESDK